jgi:hypothetical protein
VGKLVVVDSCSHMFGEEVLIYRHKNIHEEILEVLDRTPVVRSLVSQESRRYGELLFSGKDFNGPLEEAFRSRGWLPRTLVYPGQTDYSFTVDFCKEKVGLEIQFGKYFAVQKDLYNLLYLFGLEEQERIDVGVIVIPSDALHSKMASGVGKFSSIITAIRSHARNDPAVPIWILGIDVAE